MREKHGWAGCMGRKRVWKWLGQARVWMMGGAGKSVDEVGKKASKECRHGHEGRMGGGAG